MAEEPMAIWSEVWALAANAKTIELIPGDRLITGSPVTSDSDPWDEAKALLAARGITDAPGGGLVYLHGTSCRPDHGKWIVTHVAVVEVADWSAWPLSLDTENWLADFGRPYPHGATEPPVPRDVDVANHGAGHLADQLARNAEFIAALDGTPSGADWRRHLARRRPELATMYRTDWDTLGRIPAA